MRIRPLSAPGLALLCSALTAPLLMAAPVAVNDSFPLDEDASLTVNSIEVLSTGWNTNSDGFNYSDDTFGTNGPSYADGTYEATGGNGGTGGVHVNVGRKSNLLVVPASGAYAKSFTVPAAGSYQVTVKFRLVSQSNFETNEYQLAVLEIDGTRYGTSYSAVSAQVPAVVALHRFVGDNNGGADMDSGWLTFTQNITFSAGSHTISLGGFLNNSTTADEYADIYFDDLLITGTSGLVGVLANDTGGIAPVTAVKLTDPAHGTVTLNANGSFTYTPAANYNGPDSFTYRASDWTGNSNTATVSLTVNPVNDAPAGTGESYTTAEDSPLTIAAPGVLANDTDIDSAALTASVTVQPANGTVTMSANGGFTYTPALNFNGPDSFTYRANDGAANSAPVTVSINVTPQPDAPLPVTDYYKTGIGATLTVSAAGYSAGSTTTLITAAPETVGGVAQPGDTWKYLDTGVDQGTAWRQPGFDDSGWKTGRGEFGYGDADGENRPEVTLIEDNATPGYVSGEGNRFPTYYFRKTFTVDDWRRLTAPVASLLRDDGVVIWLNGQRVYWENGLDGATYASFTAGSTPNETTHDTIALPAALPYLVDGDNVLAVEVHQQSAGSSDLSFDLGLTATERAYAGVLANDVDPEGNSMTASVVTQPAHGTLVLNPNGTFTYTPAAGYSGVDSFTYRANDGTLNSAPATVNIAVEPAANQAPLAAPNNYAASEDVLLSVNAALGVLGNDSDPEGTPLTAVLVAGPSNGTLTLNTDGGFTYRGNSNFNGTDTFTYRASDGLKQSGVVTVTLNVGAVADVPTPAPDTYRTLVGTPLTVTDTAPGGSSTVTLITPSPLGNPPVAGDTWKYLDNGSDQGTAWKESAFDDSAWKEGRGELGYGDTSDGRPETTVVSYGPSASNKYITTYFRKTFGVADKTRLSGLSMSLLRDDGAVVWLNGTRVHFDTALDTAVFSTLATNQSNESTHDTFALPSAAALLQDGPNVIAVEIHQNTVGSSDLSFDMGLTAEESSYAGVLYNDTDPEGNPFTAVIATQPANGTVTLISNGTFTYTPNAGFRGTDTFTYRAVDATGPSAPATVSVIVSNGANQAPAAAADTFAAVEDAVLIRSAAQGVLANDVDSDGDAMTAVLVSTVSNGFLSLNADGSFSYSPAANFTGTDSFTYRAKDSFNLVSPAVTVTLNVAGANDAPTAAADSYGTNPGTTLTVSAAQGVLANDSDIDGDTLTAQIVTPPASGTFSLQAAGGFTFTPSAPGTYTFTYRAFDGTDASTNAVVTIVVNGQPVAGADTYTTFEDAPLVRSAASGVLANDSDPEGSPLAATVTVQPLHGVLDFNANGAFTYTPAANYSGSDSFTYTVSDGGRTSAPALVSLTVTAVNDPPVAVDDSFGVLTGQTLNISAVRGLLVNDTDVEGSALTVTQNTQPQFGTLTLSADGSFTYVPGPGFTTGDSFTYRISDGSGVSESGTVTLFLDEPGDSIVINEILYRPGTGFPENTAQEWIELHNRGANSVNLGGWTISAGVNFTFPANTQMAPGGYLVVAANVAAFQAANPGVNNVIGGWLGTLSNGGEKIQLTDSSGKDWDKVSYASEGDWAVRIRETVFNGWAWSTGADGGGRSMELRNPRLSNDNGQNWTASVALRGTPGVANAALSANIAPVIKAVKHAPAVPLSTDRVTVSCELNDESAPEALTASLFWRDVTTTAPGAFQQTAMSWDGGNGWFAKIGTMPHLSIVEFYISASDGVNTRTWPAPTSEGQNANCLYQVSDEALSSITDNYWMVMTAAENAAFVTTTSSDSSGNKIDRQFNHTMIIQRGTESEIRYRCDMRIRGNSSRDHTVTSPNGAPAPPMRVRIPADDDLGGSTRFNLNPRASFLQFLGMRFSEAAGVRAPHVQPVELRRNGVEYTRPTGSTADMGFWVRMEDIGSELIDNHWPMANGGQAYKKGRPDRYWRATQPAPSNPDTVLDGWIKQNAGAANDWSDLTGFFTVWQSAAGPHFPGSAVNDAAESGGGATSGNGNWNGGVFTDEQIESVETVADLDQWARWFALMTILQSNETNASNGQDDDYGVYFVPRTVGAVTQRRLQFISHDLDTIFGLGDSTLAYNARGLYDATDENSVFRPLLPLLGNASSPGNAAFRQKYFTAIREMLGTVFNADTTASPNPPFHQMVDYLGGNWVTAGTRTAIKDFMRDRRTHLLGLIAAEAITPAAATSHATLTAAHGTLFISEVLANNLSAHNNSGTFPDVIEIQNSGAAAADLSGMSLTDDPLVKAKYVFPAGTTLASGARMVVYADTATTAPGVHAGFGLNSGGDAVYLFTSATAGQSLVDSVTFGLQPPDYSIGRTGAALDTWALCTPTPGAANTAVPSLASPAGLRINEWLGNADYRASNDFIELYNPAAQPVPLAGMSLTNDVINFPALYTIPALSYMAPGAFIAFESTGSAGSGDARELPFNIDSSIGHVALLGANGTLVDRGETLTQFRDVSTARIPDGSGAFTAMAPPTPGSTNAPLSAAQLAVLNNLRITELMYNPPSAAQAEYIEFRNISATAELDLSGVTFTNGITFTFPAGTSLAPGAFLVITGDAARFSAQFPAVPAGGVFTGRLDNGGERIRLEIPGAQVAVLDFTYSDAWYASTDGGGDALQIVNAEAPLSMWDRSEGWQAALPSPGSFPAFTIYAGPDIYGAPGVPVVLNGNLTPGAFQTSAIAIAWTKESGPGSVTFTTPNCEDANAVFSVPGVYTLRLTATASGPVTASDLLTVAVTESYSTWSLRTMPAVTGAARAQSADPDGDGLNNLAEYVLGGNPSVVDASSLMSAFALTGQLVLEYRRNPLADPAITILPELSPDLDTGWTDASGAVQQSVTAGANGYQLWRATLLEPFTAATRRFLRLRITAP